MLFYVAKAFQAAGMGIIAFDFIRSFPQLMSPRILLIGITLFITGWIINRFLLER